MTAGASLFLSGGHATRVSSRNISICESSSATTGQEIIQVSGQPILDLGAANRKK